MNEIVQEARVAVEQAAHSLGEFMMKYNFSLDRIDFSNREGTLACEFCLEGRSSRRAGGQASAWSDIRIHCDVPLPLRG